MQIENDAGAALLRRDDPRALKIIKLVILHDNVVPVYDLHQLAELVLPLARDLKRASGDKGLEKVELRPDKFCRKTH